MFSWKNKSQSKICIFTPKVCLKLPPTKMSPNFSKKIAKTTILAQKRACDVLRRFLRRLQRFLRRPATFSATPCDVLRRRATFLAVFGRFCHIWPCPSHILENKGKPPTISGLMFGFPQPWWESGQGSLWQRLCCCTVWQNQIESLWWCVCSVSWSNTESASFQFSESTTCRNFSEISSTCPTKRVLPRSPWFESMTAMQRKRMVWEGGGYMLDELSKIGSFKSLQNPNTFSEELMLRAFGFKLRIQKKGQSSVFGPHELRILNH